jgi:hypothetical protein
MDRWSPLLLATLTLACGGVPEVPTDEVAEPIESCALNASLSGTLRSTIDESASMGCATLDEEDSGIDSVFLLASNVAQFQVMIEHVREGEVGVGFPASVNLYDMSSGRWGTPEGACTVDIFEHTFDFTEEGEDGELRAYAVAGKGHCTGEAQPTGQGAYGLVAIGEFDFRLPSIWRD